MADQDKSGQNGDETVPKTDFLKVQDELSKFKKSATENEKIANDLKTRLEALEHEKKTSEGDYKSLYEQTKSQLDDFKNSHEKLKGNLVLTQKHSAVSQALTKAGLKPEFLPLIEKENFDDVVFETTSAGRFLVTGAEVFVDKFKKQYPSAFESGKAPVINAGGGASGGEKNESITGSMLFECEKKCRAKGDMKEYNTMLAKMVEQRKKKTAS